MVGSKWFKQVLLRLQGRKEARKEGAIEAWKLMSEKVA